MSDHEDGESFDAATGAIEALSKFSTHIGRRWRDPNGLIDLIDSELFGIEGRLHDLGEKSRRDFGEVPALIQHDIGHLPLFEAAMLSHAAMHLAGSSWGTAVPEHSQYLFAGLSTRAISTVRGIAILLDHGYALGAKSRWRTLSEILVVARVIAQGDRFTATRYREHRWIILAKERARSGLTEWPGDLPSPEVMKRRLVRRFGPEYAGLYGWAARVTSRGLGVAKPGWHHLQQLARVDEHAGRVQDAHHAVHGADALGLLGTIDFGSGQFHAGASPQGILEVARDTTRLFLQTLSAVFEICFKYTSSRKPQILQGVVEVHLLTLESDLGWRILSTNADVLARYSAMINDWLAEIEGKPAAE